mgnify:CR=1 FL=1
MKTSRVDHAENKNQNVNQNNSQKYINPSALFSFVGIYGFDIVIVYEDNLDFVVGRLKHKSVFDEFLRYRRVGNVFENVFAYPREFDLSLHQ